jgi:obg-like ATPase 1
VGVTPHYYERYSCPEIFTLSYYFSGNGSEELTVPQIDVVNNLQLLTAKPVTYLVNLSEKDYIRKKNKWCVFVPGIRGPNDPGRRLPKIKAWIDEHNPGDPLIPFSVALEERLGPLSAEEKEEEQKKAGAQSALGKITTAGYTSLDVG